MKSQRHCLAAEDRHGGDDHCAGYLGGRRVSGAYAFRDHQQLQEMRRLKRTGA
jgi:hypothetical protein